MHTYAQRYVQADTEIPAHAKHALPPGNWIYGAIFQPAEVVLVCSISQVSCK